MLDTAERDGIHVVTMDHGKVNALDLELLQALTDALRTAPDSRPIVLTGAGRAFSAGVDLSRIVGEGPAYTTQFLDALSSCFLAVFDHPGPTVAAINGAAIAGGCVIAAACDLRVISRGPIGLAELAVGVPFPTCALEIMRSVLGHRTQSLVLSACTLDPGQAMQIGLVDEIVAADQLLARAVDVAQQLGSLPPGVFSFTKAQLQAPARERIRHQEDDDLVTRQLWASAGVRDAVRSYMKELTGH